MDPPTKQFNSRDEKMASPSSKKKSSAFGFFHRKKDSRNQNVRDSLMSFSRKGQLTVKRPIYSEALFDEGFVPDSRPSRPLGQAIRLYFTRHCTCSKDCFMRFIYNLFPFLTILRGYGLKTDLVSDIIGGLTVGIMHIPQGMAYALLANLAPVNGLYVSFFPVFIYFLFGSSRHISIGTFAIVCLMIGTVVERTADVETKRLLATGAFSSNHGSDNATVINGTTPVPAENGTKSLDDLVMESSVSVALALTFVVGVLQLLMGICRFGFVTIYLSQPLVSGFTTGAACHVLTSQIKYILGIRTTQRFSGPFKFVKNYIELFTHIATVNWAEFITSSICLIVIAVTKEVINPRVKGRLKMPIPIDLIVVTVGTFVSYFAHLNEDFKVRIVGEIPTGIPPPQAPNFSLIPNLIGDAFAIAIVSFAVSISLAKILAERNNYEVDSNQELIAYGMTNFVCSFFNCFVSSGSMSRSLVQEVMGGKTQVAGLFSCVLIFFVLIAVGPLFESLPNCVLAAIIIVALKGMFTQFRDLKKYWNISKYDFAIWLVTWLSVVVLDVDLGLGVGVGFSLLTVVFRTQRPYCAVLGRIPHTDIYKDPKVYTICKEVNGIKVLRFESSLYYANAEHFRQRVYHLSKANPLNLAAERNKILAQVQQERDKIEKEKRKAQKKQEKELKRRRKTGMNGTSAGNGDGQAPETPVQPTVTVSIEEEHQPLHETARDIKTPELPKYDIHHIILDCSMMSYMDTVGVSTLGQLILEYKNIDINVFLANCKGGVRDMLFRTGFYDTHEREILYVSVHDAVLSALQGGTELANVLQELKQDTEIVTTTSIAGFPDRTSRSVIYPEHYVNPHQPVSLADEELPEPRQSQSTFNRKGKVQLRSSSKITPTNSRVWKTATTSTSPGVGAVTSTQSRLFNIVTPTNSPVSIDLSEKSDRLPPLTEEHTTISEILTSEKLEEFCNQKRDSI